jgi:hypothetical protein
MIHGPVEPHRRNYRRRGLGVILVSFAIVGVAVFTIPHLKILNYRPSVGNAEITRHAQATIDAIHFHRNVIPISPGNPPGKSTI